MVLGMPSGLFGKNNKLTDNREFTRAAQKQSMWIIPIGNTVTGNISTNTENIGYDSDLLGFEIAFGAKNALATSQDINLTITNITKSVNIVYGEVTLIEKQGVTVSNFFSTEVVSPGDVIRLALGGDGVGTKAGANIFGYFYLNVIPIFKRQDESDE